MNESQLSGPQLRGAAETQGTAQHSGLGAVLPAHSQAFAASSCTQPEFFLLAPDDLLSYEALCTMMYRSFLAYRHGSMDEHRGHVA